MLNLRGKPRVVAGSIKKGRIEQIAEMQVSEYGKFTHIMDLSAIKWNFGRQLMTSLPK